MERVEDPPPAPLVVVDAAPVVPTAGVPAPSGDAPGGWAGLALPAVLEVDDAARGCRRERMAVRAGRVSMLSGERPWGSELLAGG